MSGQNRGRAPVVVTHASPALVTNDDQLHFPLSEEEIESVVRAALEEDGAFGDLTTVATVLSGRRARGMMMARATGVLAGTPLAVAAFRITDPKSTVRIDVSDGSDVKENLQLYFISGRARAILSAERVALNFLQRLSGIATLTRKYVDAVAGTDARILDTRKTTPGWRALEKYAVRAGGGQNHRFNLADAVLIKDNHLVAVDGDIGRAVKRARRMAGSDVKIEVECDNIEQVASALNAEADIIMLDNMSPRALAASVKLARGKAVLEASGGITLDNVRSIAEIGVDWISVGALTHSAPALDLALDFDPV